MNKIKTELPGLYSSKLRDEGTAYYSYHAIIGSLADSFYEYLLKEWILLDGKNNGFRDMFLSAVDTIKKYMVCRPESGSQEYAIFGTIYSADNHINLQMEHLVICH